VDSQVVRYTSVMKIFHHLAVITCGLLVSLGCAKGSQVEAIAEIPSHELTLKVTLTATHAFLAEYDRKLLIRGSQGCHQEVSLFTDTGGYGLLHVYAGPGRQLFLRGHFDAYRLYGHCGVEVVELSSLPANLEYIGAFDNDDKGDWVFLPRSSRPLKPFKNV
jgi:hypothetical protein